MNSYFVNYECDTYSVPVFDGFDTEDVIIKAAKTYSELEGCTDFKAEIHLWTKKELNELNKQEREAFKS